ncbi:ABC transporter permease [Solwaraspora sp. WMMD1047]|uniref:ABC transporter permease n=1 Tax=Solwaraspora sp. WMMD1047 TaxID=3016102 RepID=UPI0024176C9B|nr:ABC transporter permease [Solwaraspora sp. WMMD1047]MDG4834466.1 ABC transporter permease [Solwaraspora sp. WMMD1047]
MTGRRLRTVVRRLAAYPGLLGLLAALALVAAGLVTATPRLTNEAGERALRPAVADLPHLARDLNFTARSRVNDAAVDPAGLQSRLAELHAELPAPLAGLTSDRWYSATIGPDGIRAAGAEPPFTGGPPPVFGLRAQSGVREAARLVAGAWPESPAPPGGGIEIAISRPAAETLLLAVGDVLDISGGLANNTVRATLVGLYEPLDASDPVWDDLRLSLEPIKPLADGDPYQVMAVTDWTGIDTAARTLGLVSYGWRFRIDPARLDTSRIESVTTAVVTVRRGPAGAALTTSLDGTLARFDAQLRSVRALLAVVQSGLLATLIGLILLAARLAAERRREEFALLRARGAAIGAIGARTLAESAVVVPAATVVGWLLGTLVPGRPGGAELPLVVAVGVLATVVVPVVVMAGQRRVAGAAGRRDLARQRLSARRLTAEVAVLAVAGLGLYLLHQRGLPATGTVDPYLVSVPVLLAAGTALLAQRAVRWPLRQLDRLAARLRGAVAFLGLARAGRGAPITAGPLAVLVIAISTGIFSAVLGTSIADTRDRISDREVAADALLTGYAFAPATGDRLADLPGVDAVAAALLDYNRRVLSGTGPAAETLGSVQVLVVDAAAFDRVVTASGRRVPVPATLSRATRGDGPAPAVVSPEVARLVADPSEGGPVVDVQGRLYGFTVGAVAAEVPGLRIDADRFIVLPWQALPVPEWKPIIPNRYLIAGSGFDAATVRETADAGQREHAAGVLGTPDAEVPLAAELTGWQDHRRALDRTGANEVLTLTYTVGAVGSAALALLALAFAVVAGAGSRGRALSRLRTMGLSRRQGRRLLGYELAPVVGTALLAGGLVGAALPWLLAPSLGLSSFTAGLPTGIRLDPVVVAGALALVAVGLAGSLAVENLVNRRARLGAVLRLGEEN